jgi:galactokinase
MLAASELGVSQLAEVSPKTLGGCLERLPEPINRRAKHVIDEIGRVHAVAALLRLGHLQHVGRLLTASHRSSQRLFENSTAELDFLVDALVVMPHIYGARLTGGGFGGAVLAMTDADFTAEMADGVAGAYQRQFGAKPEAAALVIGRGAHVLKSR